VKQLSISTYFEKQKAKSQKAGSNVLQKLYYTKVDSGFSYLVGFMFFLLQKHFLEAQPNSLTEVIKW
jgi:hypothetical protein